MAHSLNNAKKRAYLGNYSRYDNDSSIILLHFLHGMIKLVFVNCAKLTLLSDPVTYGEPVDIGHIPY